VVDPGGGEHLGQGDEQLGHGGPGIGEPSQAGGLGLEESGGGISGRPGLGKERGAVVEREPARRGYAAAAHRSLADALVGEKCREMLGVRA
jgi:hypothetical protein